MRDADLYQLDAILNEGVHRELKARFVLNLPEYRDIDHPMPKLNKSYSQVVYSDRTTDAIVKCKHSSYYVRWYGPYHTVSDEDCLTLVRRRSGSISPIARYLRGETLVYPKALITREDHKVRKPAPVVPDDPWDNEDGFFGW